MPVSRAPISTTRPHRPRRVAWRTAAASARRWAVPLIAAVSVLGGAAGIAPSLAASPATGLPAAAPRVAVVGDSLTVQAGAALAGQLRATGAEPAVTARPGQAVTGDFAQAALAELAAQPARAGDVVVVATAANDAVVRARASGVAGAETAGAAYRRAVADVARRFADRCVVLVNARDRVNPLYEPTHAAALDADLAAEASHWPNLVVADWATASAALPEAWFATDQLHFGADPAAPATLPSADAWAGVVAGAVARCPAGPAVTSS